MATVSGGLTTAIRMDRIDVDNLIDGDVIEKSSTTLQVDKGAGVINTLRGIAFLYGGADEFLLFEKLIRGMLFNVNISAGGETTLDISGLTLTIKKFAELARAGNDAGALALAFADGDTLRGTPLNDFLNGYGGADNLFGGDGNDSLRGGAGNDHIYGQSANGGADASDTLAGEDGDDYLQGNAGSDTIDGGAGADRAQGGQGNDIVRGAAGNDSLNGNLGNDTIEGGDGNDVLRGGQGDDSISGGEGTDTLSGDLGTDTLTGGRGNDLFIFTGNGAAADVTLADRVTDFVHGADKLKMGYTVSEVLTGSNQGFESAAAAAQILFDGRAGNGEVAAMAVGRDIYLFFSSDGGGTADSAIRLVGTDANEIDIKDFI